MQNQYSQNSNATESSANRSCPDWAQVMIDQLLQVEIFLGNIPKSLEWSSERIEQVQRKLYSDEKGTMTDEVAEILFQRICKGLKVDNFSDLEIADFVNSRVAYKGGPKYCNESDIKEALI